MDGHRVGPLRQRGAGQGPVHDWNAKRSAANVNTGGHVSTLEAPPDHEEGRSGARSGVGGCIAAVLLAPMGRADRTLLLLLTWMDPISSDGIFLLHHGHQGGPDPAAAGWNPHRSCDRSDYAGR